jgi:hypothetical protein
VNGDGNGNGNGFVRGEDAKETTDASGKKHELTQDKIPKIVFCGNTSVQFQADSEGTLCALRVFAVE